MPLIEGLQLPFGIQPVNPVPSNAWEGPYTSITEALLSIPMGVRFPTMEVRILDSVSGNAKYWFKDGIDDADLIPFGVDLASIISGETEGRVSGDTMLYNMITGETNDRIQQDTILNNKITGLTETVNENYLGLYDLITGETYDRTVEDVFLQAKITGLTYYFDTHTGDTNNPHNVTASQIGVYTSGETNMLLDGKSSTGHTHSQYLTGYTETNPGVYTSGQTDELLLGKSNTGHTHEYLPLSGGTINGVIMASGFTGDGSGLTNIPASGVTDLNLDRISSGDSSAIISSSGMTVNTGVTATSFITSGGTSNDFVKGDGSLDAKAYITLSDIPSQVITENIPVSLSGGKTLGKYVNGQTIMSSGMTVTQLFKDIAIEALPPTVSLSSPTTIAFNQTSISNILNFSYVINSLGATVQTVSLDWRRGGSGSWVNLLTTTGSTTYTHNYTDTSGNTSAFNYRYIVTDTAGGVATGTTNITPAAYIAPSINSMSAGTTSRDLGNISSTITATIVRNSTNVLLSTYKIQRSVNGGSYSDISGTLTTISGSSYNVSYVDNDNTLLNSTSIAYRIVVTDTYSATTGSSATVSFTHRNFLGYSSNSVLSLNDILGLTNSTLTNSKSRTVSNVTAGVGNYTYYVYASSAGDLTNCLLDGVEAILGAFTKLTDVTGTNSYGANVSYRVYKSNSTNAFTNNSLIFS